MDKSHNINFTTSLETKQVSRSLTVDDEGDEDGEEEDDVGAVWHHRDGVMTRMMMVWRWVV